MTKEFEEELLPEHLEKSDCVSVRSAVCWLGGLPVGDLDDFDASNPRDRILVKTGRTERSTNFWLEVFDCIDRDPAGKKQLLDFQIHRFERKFWFKNKKHKTRRATLLREAAKRFCISQGLSIAEQKRIWEEDVQYETERRNRARSAAFALADKLPELIQEGCHSTSVSQVVKQTALGKSGYRLDVKNETLFKLEDEDAKGIRAISLWDHLVRYKQVQACVKLTFNHEDLVRVFVTEPDRERDLWIKDILEHPYWGLDFALVFLKHRGDMDELYKLQKSADRFGISQLIRYPIDGFDLDGFDGSIISLAESLFKKGKLTAYGLKTGATSMEKVPLPDWAALKIFSDYHPEKAYLAPPEVPHRTRWDDVQVESAEVTSIVQELFGDNDEKSIAEKPSGSSTIVAQKRAKEALIDDLRTKNPRSHTKQEIIESVVERTGSSLTQVRKLWGVVLSEHIEMTLRDLWLKPGPRDKSKAPNSNYQ